MEEQLSSFYDQWLRRLESMIGAGLGFTTAGTGLTSSGATVNAAANADGSIVVNANDIQVGVINAAQHGNQLGGTLHAAATNSVAGFASAAQITALEGAVTNIAALVTADSALDTRLDALELIDHDPLTLAAFGAAPASAGASLSSQVLTLQPASASAPGGIALGTQTLGSGTKTVDALVVTGDITADTTTLKVDATNNRVGIGTASPTSLLDVYDTANTRSNLRVYATNAVVSVANGVTVNGAETGGSGGSLPVLLVGTGAQCIGLMSKNTAIGDRPCLIIGDGTSAGGVIEFQNFRWIKDNATTSGLEVTTKNAGAAGSVRLSLTGGAATTAVNVTNADFSVSSTLIGTSVANTRVGFGLIGGSAATALHGQFTGAGDAVFRMETLQGSFGSAVGYQFKTPTKQFDMGLLGGSYGGGAALQNAWFIYDSAFRMAITSGGLFLFKQTTSTGEDFQFTGTMKVTGAVASTSTSTATAFITATATPATAGIVRLANADGINWRNNANGANIILGKDTSDNLEWGGVDVTTVSNTQTFTNKSVGAGTGAGAGAMTGTLNVQTTQVGNVGVGEDDLMSYSLPASSLVVTGRGVRWNASGALANNANAKTIKLYFGATMLTAACATSIAANWFATVHVYRTGSSAQRYVVRLEVIDTGTNAVSNIFTAQGTLTQTESGAITIKATGEATSNDDIVQNTSIIEFV
jgi:hypothetical protein